MSAESASVADLLGLIPEDRFEVAEGLYWYCADYHGGQRSEEYRIMCGLRYRPGPLERGPEEVGIARDVYAALERGDVSAKAVSEWVAATYGVAS